MNLKSFIIYLIPIVSIVISITIYNTHYKQEKEQKGLFQVSKEAEQQGLNTLENFNNHLKPVNQNQEEVAGENQDDAFISPQEKNLNEFGENFIASLRNPSIEVLEYFDERNYIHYVYENEKFSEESFLKQIRNINSARYNTSFKDSVYQYIVVTINEQQHILSVVEKKDIHTNQSYYTLDQDIEQFLTQIQ